MELKLTLSFSFKQLKRICKIESQWIVVEIDSKILFDNVSVPLLLKCSFGSFECMVMIVSPCCIKRYYFLEIIPSSARMFLQLYIDDHRFRMLSLIKSYQKSCFLLVRWIAGNLLRLLICWYIFYTNINYKVMNKELSNTFFFEILYLICHKISWNIYCLFLNTNFIWIVLMSCLSNNWLSGEIFLSQSLMEIHLLFLNSFSDVSFFIFYIILDY